MKNRTLSLFLVLGLLGSSTSWMGCAGKAFDENDPAILYREAEEDITNDHYQLALDKLRVIKNKFPYSKYSLDAQLRIADVYFMQEAFGEAALSYESFKDLHPKHERVPYAMYRTAISYYSDMPDNVSRDMTSGQKALDSFGEFILRFPNAPDTPEAQKKVTEVRENLAQKELYVGNFYYREDEYDSAKGRYSKILALYPETKAAEAAKGRIAKIEQLPKKKSDKEESPRNGSTTSQP